MLEGERVGSSLRGVKGAGIAERAEFKIEEALAIPYSAFLPPG